jgi:hypothetical protein
MKLLNKPCHSQQNLRKPTIRMPQYSEKKLCKLEVDNRIPKLNLAHLDRKVHKFQVKENHLFQPAYEPRQNKH